MRAEIFKFYHCERKRPFDSIKTANNFIKKSKKRGIIIDSSLTIYKCQFCGKFHLGHNNRGGD